MLTGRPRRSRKSAAGKSRRTADRRRRLFERLEDRNLLSISTFSSGVSTPIPDQGTAFSTIQVAESITIDDLNVTLDITHISDADLDVFLIAPDGTRVELFTDVGGGGDDFSATTLDDEAATSITTGTAPFSGGFRPEGSLSALDGKDTAGEWKLELTDDKRRKTGTLNSWSIDVTSAGPPVSSFTVAMLPDTQFYSQSYPEQFNAQTQWIVDNLTTENLAFVSQVGDVVQNGGGSAGDNFNELEWTRADAAVDIMDGDLVANPDGLIPYSIAPGNHDFDIPWDNSSATRFLEFFGPSRYSGRTWYGGYSADQTSQYQLFSAEGRDYLHISLEWQPRTAAITWAQSVIDAHPNLPVILSTHEYLGTSLRTSTGERIFQDLVQPNEQIFMVLSGHVGGEFHQISQNDLGLDVIEILADYQSRSNGGDGWMQLLEFLPDLDRIDVQTYSPTLNQYETDANSQFSLDIDFDDRFDFTTPRLSIGDAAIPEGANGTTTDIVFSVTRFGDISGAATVDWITADGTAAAGSDYTAGSGQLSFAPDVSEQTITVTIIGNDIEESHKDFSINLSSPFGAALGDGTAVGTILNDETSISVNDVTVSEGDGATRFIDAFLGAGSNGLDAPREPVFGPDSNGDGVADLYIASQNSNEILRFDGSTDAALPPSGNTGATFVAAGAGGLIEPLGLAIGPDINSDGVGELYVSSRDTRSVMRYDGVTGTPLGLSGNPADATFVAMGTTGTDRLRALVFDTNGNLYVSRDDFDSILRYDAVTGAPLPSAGNSGADFVAAGLGGLDRPIEMVLRPDGNLYVVSRDTNSVLRYNATTGSFIDEFVSSGSGGLTSPFGLEFSPDGTRLYVTDNGNQGVLRYNGTTGAFLDVFIPSGSGGLDNPVGPTFGPDGNFYLSSFSTDEVLRYGEASQAAFTVSLSSPSGNPVTVDFSTADETATAGSDYTVTSGTITFAPGETSKTILVETIDDTEVEGVETFAIDLTNATGGATIADAQAQATILNDDDPLPTISHPDFSDSAGLTMIGQSTIAANRLSLSSNGDRWGGAWSDSQQFVSTAFETSFDFQLDPSNSGFAFVIQNQQPVMLGKELGYGGIPNSVVIEFDTGQGGADPNDNHVSVQTLGEERNSSDHSASLGWASAAADLNDGQVHTATIRYIPGTLTIFVDDLSTPLLEVALDLQDTLNLDLGRAWLGFTTGANQADLLNWTFTPQVNLSTAVGISDTRIIEGESASTQLAVTVTRFGSGEFTLNWSTADRAALASTDYLADSGTLSFLAAGPDQQTFTVTVLGDSLEETHEDFSINLSLASGSATIVDGQGFVTILNDDTTIAISDATATEGDQSYKFMDVLVPRTIAGLNEPRGMDIGDDGNIYVTSEKGAWPGAVLRYDGQSGSFIDVFASDPALDGAKDLEFGLDGNLYVTNNGTNTVVRFDGTTGAFMDVFVTPNSGGLDVPRGLAFGADITGDGTQELYVASAVTDEILHYNGATGASLGAFVAAGSGGMLEPTAIQFGPDGNLYVAIGAHAQANNAVLRYDGTSGAFIDEFIPAGTAGLQLAPTGGMLFGSDLTGDGIAELLVSNGGPDEVLAFDGATGAFLQVLVSGGSGGLGDPKGLALDASGNLLVVSNGTDEILRFGENSKADFQVQLSSPSGVPVTVDFATADGTATAGSDYTAASGTITFAPGETSKTILVETIDDSNVEGVEAFAVNLTNATGGATITDAQGQATILNDDGEVIPNDPMFSDQWGLNNTGQTGGAFDADIDAPAAWSVTTGSMSTVVAVLDNGVDYMHEDLYLNIWLNQGEIPVGLAASLTDTDADGLITFRDLNDAANAAFVSDLNGTGFIDGGDLLADLAWEDGIDTDGNGFIDDLIGWDFQNNDNDPSSGLGYAHGSVMAGIIGAIGANSVGVTGLNWAVQIMQLYTHINQPGNDANAILALNYAVQGGATISSNSWGGSPYNQAFYDAIEAAGANGHLFIAAAHNQSSDNDTQPLYPASYDLDNIISVAATDELEQLASFSNYGLTSVDLAAPSPNILATSVNNTYGTSNGSSASTAQTTGVAALLRTLHPSWTYSQIKSQILSTVDPLPSLDGKTVTGGRLNAAAAVSTSSIHVSDPSIIEGNSGTTELVFTVSRRGDSSQSLTLDWTTADGTATAGSDYVAGSGQVVFGVGMMQQTISVVVSGDAIVEADETLYLNLVVAAGNTTIADEKSQATILDDDGEVFPTTRFSPTNGP